MGEEREREEEEEKGMGTMGEEHGPRKKEEQ